MEEEKEQKVISPSALCPLTSQWFFSVSILRMALQGHISTQQGSLHKKKSNQKLIWLNGLNPSLMLPQTACRFRTTWYTRNAHFPVRWTWFTHRKNVQRLISKIMKYKSHAKRVVFCFTSREFEITSSSWMKRDKQISALHKVRGGKEGETAD